MSTTEPERVTPRHLLVIALLGCITAALLSAAPLASWVSASSLAGTQVERAADAWLGLMQRLGLDRPYDLARNFVRSAESAHFDTGD
jgi:hypothetical protein